MTDDLAGTPASSLAWASIHGRWVEASSTGTRFVVGAWERDAVIVDFESGSTSRTIETIFDGGGRRVALSDEFDALVAAAYHGHGLAAYSSSTGAQLWNRKDLKRIQRIGLSSDGAVAFCGADRGPLVGVDVRTGETVLSLRGAQAVHESRFDAIRLVDGASPRIQAVGGGDSFSVKRTTFAFLSVCFAPGLVALSESGGPVRCLDVATGQERWRYSPRPGCHVLTLGYRASLASMLGVEWSYVDGGPKRVIQWTTSGAVDVVTTIGEPIDCCFGSGGEAVGLSDGRVLRVGGSGART